MEFASKKSSPMGIEMRDISELQRKIDAHTSNRKTPWYKRKTAKNTAAKKQSTQNIHRLFDNGQRMSFSRKSGGRRRHRKSRKSRKHQ